MVVLLLLLVVVVLGGSAGLLILLRRQAALQVGGAGVAGSIGAGDRIDPFTVGEPWRHFVQDAVRAQTRFRDVVSKAPQGPLRETLVDIGRRLDEGVAQVWATAQQGQTLRQARRRIDAGVVSRRLEEARAIAAKAQADDPLSLDDTATRTVQSLESQLASAQRLDDVTAQAEARLKLLQAQLDEAVARAAELGASSAADASALAGVGDDVDHVVLQMEALRQALEETGGSSPPSANGSSNA